MTDVCAEKHRQIDKHNEISDKRLDNHGERIDKLERIVVAQEKDTTYLREVLKDLKISVDKLIDAIDKIKYKPLDKYEQIAMYILLAVIGVAIGKLI